MSQRRAFMWRINKGGISTLFLSPFLFVPFLKSLATLYLLLWTLLTMQSEAGIRCCVVAYANEAPSPDSE